MNRNKADLIASDINDRNLFHKACYEQDIVIVENILEEYNQILEKEKLKLIQDLENVVKKNPKHIKTELKNFIKENNINFK